MASIDKQEVHEAYEDVRNDETPTKWLLLRYEDDNSINLAGKGDDYEDLRNALGEDDRAFAFVRVTMGDELSKRAKFALISWAGSNVGGIKRAKMSTAKSVVKQVIKSFAAEISATDHGEVELEVVKEALLRAGGANYGTGVRE